MQESVVKLKHLSTTSNLGKKEPNLIQQSVLVSYLQACMEGGDLPGFVDVGKQCSKASKAIVSGSAAPNRDIMK